MNLRTIALVAQKGGVGKTTMAVNLAVAAGLRRSPLKTALFDLDGQESAAIWSERRKADLPHVEHITERKLSAALAAADKQGFDLAIIDTPPAAGPEALTAAQAADLVLIPCRPSLVDLDAIRRTAQLVKGAGITAYVVFNAAAPGATTLLDDAAALVKRAGLTPAPVVLRERSIYRAAWPAGQGVTEAEPKGKAAGEIAELMDWVCAELKVCTPDGVKESAAHG